MCNRELIETVLKRVSALTGVNGKLYKDNTGWFIIWSDGRFDEGSRTANQLLSYLRGIEDAYLTERAKTSKLTSQEERQANVWKQLQEVKAELKDMEFEGLAYDLEYIINRYRLFFRR